MKRQCQTTIPSSRSQYYYYKPLLLTAVFLFASVISISAYPTGPARYPQGPLRGAVLEAPIATSGNNTCLADGGTTFGKTIMLNSTG